tara:strand:- start:318 stop:653 length:336 start_codon:yes stop_codon:yes gene_type:complete
MFFTEGDTRYIKRHTEKSLKELYGKTKGVKMKPTKKRPAKRKPLHGESNPLVAKLLNLKYRLNDAYTLRDEDTKDHKAWVMKLISEVRLNNLTKLAKEDMLLCNSLWKRYE